MLSLKKNIVIVFDGSLSSVGGAERFAINLATIYRVIGFKSLLLMFGSKISFLKNREVLALEVPTVKVMRRSILFGSPKVFKLVLQVIRNADAIHILYCESPLNLLIALVGKILNKKIIASPLASLSFLFHHSKLKAVLSFPILFIKLIIARLANIVHVASLYDYRYLRVLNNFIVVIPHSFTIASKLIDNIHGKTSAQLVRGNFFLNFKGVRLCFLGRFSEDKGSLIALETLRILRSKSVDAHLIIIGPRIHVFESLVRYAKRYGLQALKEVLPYVHALGYLHEEDKYRLLKNCNVGLIPSLSDAVEAFSIALSEFNALGIPVVASAVGALKYRLKHYAGVVVKPRDAMALVKGVLQALHLEKVGKLPDVITLEQEAILWKKALRKL